MVLLPGTHAARGPVRLRADPGDAGHAQDWAAPTGALAVTRSIGVTTVTGCGRYAANRERVCDDAVTAAA